MCWPPPRPESRIATVLASAAEAATDKVSMYELAALLLAPRQEDDEAITFSPAALFVAKADTIWRL